MKQALTKWSEHLHIHVRKEWGAGELTYVLMYEDTLWAFFDERKQELMPLSVLSGVIENGSEDVHKKKCHLPVKLLVTGQVAIPTQIPGHP
jgi:hypothetical protein